MNRQLTDDQLTELCRYMRVIDLMKANEHILAEQQEFKRDFEMFSKKVEEIMNILPEEEWDMVLEEHRLQLQMLKEEKIQKK